MIGIIMGSLFGVILGNLIIWLIISKSRTIEDQIVYHKSRIIDLEKRKAYSNGVSNE